MDKYQDLPKHIAIIMDGNGRWAKKRLLPRNMGHRQGVQALIKLVRYVSKTQIKALSVFAFSTENWSRPKEEVDYLMNLLKENLTGISDKLKNENVRLIVIGEKFNLSNELLDTIEKVQNETKNNTGLILNIAFNYGSKDEIIHAVKEMINNNQEITKENLENNLYTQLSQNVDLLIRTSGECRISNFLLWQIAYSELYFTKKYWPDFTPKELEKALDAYKNRDRRFGGLKDEK